MIELITEREFSSRVEYGEYPLLRKKVLGIARNRAGGAR